MFKRKKMLTTALKSMKRQNNEQLIKRIETQILCFEYYSKSSGTKYFVKRRAHLYMSCGKREPL